MLQLTFFHCAFGCEETRSEGSILSTKGAWSKPCRWLTGSGGRAFQAAASRSTAERLADADGTEPALEPWEGADAENTSALPLGGYEEVEETGQEEANAPSGHGPDVVKKHREAVVVAITSSPSVHGPEAMLPTPQLELAVSDESKAAADEDHNNDVEAGETA